MPKGVVGGLLHTRQPIETISRCVNMRSFLVGLLFALVAGTGAQAKLVRHPYLQNVTANSIVICWQTDLPASARLTVRPVGAAADAPERVINVPPTAARQEVAVEKLRADTAYNYRLHIDHAESGGSFRTAPPPGRPFKFAVLSDSYANPPIARKIARAILIKRPNLVLHCGNMVDSAGDPFAWNQQFFLPFAHLLRNIPVYPAVGSHELTDPSPAGRELFAQTFALPPNERYYSFDYGNVHFCVLDSNGLQSPHSDQYRWARQDLLNARAEWKIVLFHHPIYSAGYRPSHVSMRTTYAPLFARAGVDLIITGHEHSYQRSKFIHHKLEPAHQRPYLHVITGGGGAKLYAPRIDEVWSNAAVKRHHFVLFSIDGPVLAARAIDVDGNILDQWTLDHNKPIPLIEAEALAAAEADGRAPKQQQHTHPTYKTEYGPMAYERIELVRLLSVPQWDVTTNSPPALLFDEIDQPRTFTATWSNPLAIPVKVVVQPFPDSGVSIQPPISTVNLTPAGEPGSVQSTEFTVKLVRDKGHYRPCRFEGAIRTEFGTDPTRLLYVPVGLRRTARAVPTRLPITVDGRLDEAAWQHAPAVAGEFIRRVTGHKMSPGRSPEVRVLVDGENVYIGVTVAVTSGYEPVIDESIARSDHVLLFFATEGLTTHMAADASGRTRVPEGASCVSTISNDTWTVEASVPRDLIGATTRELTGATTSLVGISGGLVGFNVGLVGAGEWSMWSATGGRAISRRTCGWLELP